MTKKAYLSSLGSMGKRHLLALISMGYDVEAFDPSLEAFDKSKVNIIENGLCAKKLRSVNEPTGSYEIAIFSETADKRFRNFEKFLEKSFAKKILLEKPLSSYSLEVKKFYNLAKKKKIEKSTFVNFSRRVLDHIIEINKFCKKENNFVMMLNGGAIGLGCNGIHYLDKFILFSGNEMPNIKWVSLSNEIIKSGRGNHFFDYGGDFILSTSRGILIASLSSNSSANVNMSIKGKHFLINVDYTNSTYQMSQRLSDSRLPLYKYGADYKVIKNINFEILNLKQVIQNLIKGTTNLPNLELAIKSHILLDKILRKGGIKPPYSYT